MPSGLMQLVAYGAESLYLTGNPQITFFKTVYRRHTNFAMEYIEQYFTSIPSFSSDKVTISTVKIERNADLVYDCYLLYDLPAIYSHELFKYKWVNNVGLRIIDYVEIFVAGQLLDKQYGQWMYIWNELTLPLSKRGAYNKMVGNIPTLTAPNFYHGFYTSGGVPSIPSTRLLIPLEFWFCKNAGLAIPLIALQYTELTINVHFNPLNDLFVIEHLGVTYSPKNVTPLVDVIKSTNYVPTYGQSGQDAADEFLSILETSSGLIWFFINGTTSSGLWNENTNVMVNYIYLDTDERRKFALTSHEYLMTQVNRLSTGGLKGSNNVIEYKFQHPIKDMVWVFQRDDANIKNDWNNYTNLSFGEKFNTTDYDDYENDVSAVVALKRASETGNLTPFNPVLFNNYSDIMYDGKFIFNGKDRFSERTYKFFNALVPYKYDTNSPAEGIYSYSFALYPEKSQPSGNCNYSRINRFQMDVDLRDARTVDTDVQIYYDMFVYGLNYNVFRIIAGIGGVAFS